MRCCDWPSRRRQVGHDSTVHVSALNVRLPANFVPLALPGGFNATVQLGDATKSGMVKSPRARLLRCESMVARLSLSAAGGVASVYYFRLSERRTLLGGW